MPQEYVLICSFNSWDRVNISWCQRVHQFHQLRRIEVSQEAFWTPRHVTKDTQLVEIYRSMFNTWGYEHKLYYDRLRGRVENLQNTSHCWWDRKHREYSYLGYQEVVQKLWNGFVTRPCRSEWKQIRWNCTRLWSEGGAKRVEGSSFLFVPLSIWVIY